MSKIKYIVFTANVNSLTVSRLRQVIQEVIIQKYDEIYFLISSGGGDVFEGLSVASLIQALPMQTTMHNIGQIDSVATVIFAAGKQRFSNKDASFMFHGVRVNSHANGYLESELKELHDLAVRLKKDIATGVSTYINKPLQDIESLMVDGGNTLNAEKAKEAGIIQNILEPSIPEGADIIVIGN